MIETIIIAVIVNFFATFGLGIKAYYDYKGKKAAARALKRSLANPGNPGPRVDPREFKLLGDRVLKLEVKFDGLKEMVEREFTDIKKDIEKLFRKSNGLRK